MAEPPGTKVATGGTPVKLPDGLVEVAESSGLELHVSRISVLVVWMGWG